MTILGTDLLIGGTASADDLAEALGRELDVERRHIFQAKLFTWEQGPPPDPASASYFSALRKMNTVLIRELEGRGDLAFIVDIEFLTPVPTRSLQRLADGHGLVVGLSRDTAYPAEIGTAAAEGYVLFRAGREPVCAAVREGRVEGAPMTWGILDTPIPPLPDLICPGPTP